MYGKIEFKNWTAQRETKYSKLSYYYKEQKINEEELKKYVKIKDIEKVKIFLMNNEIDDQDLTKISKKSPSSKRSEGGG